MSAMLDTAKSAVELTKQVVIAVVIIVLLLNPAAIGSWIERTSITEGEILGFKWKKAKETQFQETDKNLIAALADKKELTEQLNRANEAIRAQGEILVQLQEKTSPAAPQASARIAEVIASGNKVINQSETAITTAQQNTQAAQQTIAANSQFVARPEAGASTQWIIIAGSDSTEASAMDEVRRAQRAGFENVKLFNNRGVYRTAIVYLDRQTAGAALSLVRDKMRQDAYMVSLDKWCPNGREVKPGLVECSPA